MRERLRGDARRHNSSDYKRLPHHAEAHLTWALICAMAKRLATGRVRPDTYPTQLCLKV